jgi:hypothetical protein
MIWIDSDADDSGLESKAQPTRLARLAALGHRKVAAVSDDAIANDSGAVSLRKMTGATDSVQLVKFTSRPNAKAQTTADAKPWPGHCHQREGIVPDRLDPSITVPVAVTACALGNIETLQGGSRERQRNRKAPRGLSRHDRRLAQENCATCGIHKSRKHKGADDGGRQALFARQCCQVDPGSTRPNPARGIMDHNCVALAPEWSAVIGHFCTGRALSGFRTPYRR